MKEHSSDSLKQSKDIKKYMDFHHNRPLWKRIRENVIIFGILNLIWFLLRTGKKPTRFAYPCQQVALNNVSASASSVLATLSFSVILVKLRKLSSFGKIAALGLLILTPITTVIILQTTASSIEIGIPIDSQIASEQPSSDIYIVNGRDVAHITDLINLMGNNSLNFYQSSIVENNTGPDGLIASTDVVLIKNNCQWGKRGGTNTDLLKELIQAIIDHPDGFTGEIVVADNGQGRGSMDWGESNAEDHSQSTQVAVDAFSAENQVSTYLWDDIMSIQVDEYSVGDMDDGYVLNSTTDAETEITVTYPKFETDYGTKISFKHGIWNGSHYEQRLKVINMPILKSHSGYGVTAALKHYMGVQSQPLGQGHDKIDTGGMGTLMVELGLPTLNILDAIWINANPETSSSEGPSTDYKEATRVNMILASQDPVALDYWAAKNVLLKTSEVIGYTDTYSLDPNSTDSSGLEEAFGVWLDHTEEELLRAGYNVTSNETKMNIYANSIILDVEIIGTDYSIWIVIGSISGGLVLVAITTLVFLRAKGLLKIKK